MRKARIANTNNGTEVRQEGKTALSIPAFNLGNNRANAVTVRMAFYEYGM